MNELNLAARVARKDATLVEIDRNSARVRHSGALKLGGEVPLSFVAKGEVFSALTHVLSCRVVGLGLGEAGSTLFESKLAFDDDRAREAVERVMGAVGAAHTA